MSPDLHEDNITINNRVTDLWFIPLLSFVVLFVNQNLIGEIGRRSMQKKKSFLLVFNRYILVKLIYERFRPLKIVSNMKFICRRYQILYRKYKIHTNFHFTFYRFFCFHFSSESIVKIFHNIFKCLLHQVIFQIFYYKTLGKKKHQESQIHNTF